MTKQNRQALRTKIISAVMKMTAEASKKDSVATIGGHKIAYRLMYAGGSQWCGCGRDWDRVESGWGWVVDDQYRLTAPDLFGFDGHNMIERQTGYYLMDGYDPQTTPEHDGRDEIDCVPNRILLEIGRGLAAAASLAEAEVAKENSEAAEILEKLNR